MGPSADELPKYTDKYFLKTRDVVRRFGDVDATYAVFMRRPVLCTPKLALDWLQEIARTRGTDFEIELCFAEGDWVGAGEPLMYVSGPLGELIDLETVFLQRLGPPCVAAFNAFLMCTDLPYVGFLAMDARHCAGAEMAEMMAYAASVGSAKARREANALGFIGNATDATAHYFGKERGLGTMPHALIGYAGSTPRAAEMFHEAFPDDPLYVLVDYFGKEVTDSLVVCRAFPDLARHRGHRSGDLPSARAARRGGLRPGQDHRQLRLRPAQVQVDGQRACAHRHHRHGLVSARTLERDLRHGRRHRVQRRASGQDRPRVPVPGAPQSSRIVPRSIVGSCPNTGRRNRSRPT
jgi:hypothetical protein